MYYVHTGDMYYQWSLLAPPKDARKWLDNSYIVVYKEIDNS